MKWNKDEMVYYEESLVWNISKGTNLTHISCITINILNILNY